MLATHISHAVHVLSARPVSPVSPSCQPLSLESDGAVRVLLANIDTAISPPPTYPKFRSNETYRAVNLKR